MKQRLERFTFRTPDGSNPTFAMDYVDVGFEMRLSKRGRRVLRFPPPYEWLEIAEDERVSAAKNEQILAALAQLKQNKA